MSYIPTQAQIWYMIKHRQCVNIVVEEPCKVIAQTGDYFLFESTRRVYNNSKCVRSHIVDTIEIKSLLKKKDTTVLFFNNFITINGKTYNGFTKAMIDVIRLELNPLPVERFNSIYDFDFEEEK